LRQGQGYAFDDPQQVGREGLRVLADRAIHLSANAITCADAAQSGQG
jgi:hypothetical protein